MSERRRREGVCSIGSLSVARSPDEAETIFDDEDASTGLEDIELFEEDSGVVGFDGTELFSQEDALDLFLGRSRTRLDGTE